MFYIVLLTLTMSYKSSNMEHSLCRKKKGYKREKFITIKLNSLCCSHGSKEKRTAATVLRHIFKKLWLHFTVPENMYNVHGGHLT